MMKRTLLPLAAAIALALSACKQDDGTAPDPVPPTNTAPPEESTPPGGYPAPTDPATPPPAEPTNPPATPPTE